MNVTLATPSSWEDVHSTFRSLRSRGFQAGIWATHPPGSAKGVVRLAREAIDARIALVDFFDHLADRGFLACYGEQDQDLYLRFAQQLDRILRTGSASDIPFMNPSRYHLRVNLRTAAELRLPPQLAERVKSHADEGQTSLIQYLNATRFIHGIRVEEVVVKGSREMMVAANDD